MKKQLVLFMLVAVFTGVNLQASTTRDKGLGLGDYSWGVDDLQGYIYENPAYLNNYQDIAFFERSGLSDGLNMGGIFYSPVEGFTFGVHFGFPVSNSVWNSEDKEGLFHTDTYSMKGLSVTTHSTSQKLLGYQAELLGDSQIVDLTDPLKGSYPVGTGSTDTYRNPLDQRNVSAIFSYAADWWGIGASFGYATSWVNKVYGTTTSINNDEYKFINTEYSATLGSFFNFSSTLGLDVSAGYKMYSLDNNYKKRVSGVDTDMSYKSSGAMDINGSAQLKYTMNPAHKLHIRAAYQMLNRTTVGKMKITDLNLSSNNVDASDTFSRKGQIIELGLTDEIKLNKKIKAYLGFDVKYEMFANEYSGKDAITPANNVDKYSSDILSITVPLLVGLEASLSDNWTGRFGLTQDVYKPFNGNGTNVTSKGAITSPTTVNEDVGSSTTLNIGLTYKLGSFTFDWLANTDLFVNGPYLISGKTTTVPMSMSFAATYHFNELIDSISETDQPVKQVKEQSNLKGLDNLKVK